MGERVEALLRATGFDAPPGSKVHGFLPVEGFSPGLDVPLVIARGMTPGPVAVVIAGVHGGEYNGIEATRRLARDLDPAQLSGTVAMIPLANRSAFHARSHNGAPPDGQNLARVFPGVQGGKALERVAHAITTRVLAFGDLMMDLHGADSIEDLTPHLYVFEARVTAEARPWKAWDLAAVYGIALAEHTGTEEIAGSAAGTAAGFGIPAILPEAGAFGHINEADTGLHYRGMTNVLRFAGMLPGTPVPDRAARRVRHERMRSPMTGFFYPAVKAGDVVAAGQVIGQISDYFGEQSTPVVAPVAGEVDFIKYSLATNKGDSLFLIAADATGA
jgi:predicted deacylase